MLFLSDLDGTLMNSNGTITEEDVNLIHQWTQKHSFGFVTGRDHAFCMELASKYQLSCEYMITDNGANAYYKDQNVYSSLIDLDNFSSRLLSKDVEMLFVVIGFSCEGTSSISIAASSFILEILILSSL